MTRIKLILLRVAAIGSFLFLFGTLIYFIIREDRKERCSYYTIRVDGYTYNTKQITMLSNNAIEFFDEKRKRKVVVNDRYIILSPTIQK